MASGLCVRVLLLSLLAFGPHAGALSYRSGDSSGVTPYFKVPSALLRGHKPALAPSRYESSAQTGGSQSGSGPSYPEGGSSDELEPAGARGYTGYYGRQVDGNSQEGSVPSYRPNPMIPSKPRENPLQPSYHANPDNIQTKKNMWNFAFPNNGNKFQLGSVSSSGIKMDIAPLSYQPQQLSSYQPQQPKQLSSYQPQQPKQPSSYQPSSYQPQQPKQPSSYQPSSYQPQQPKQPSSYQPSSYQPHQPQQPSSDQPQQPVMQRKDDMWDFALSPDGVAFDPDEMSTYPEGNVEPRNFRPTLMVAPNHPGWQRQWGRV
nr:PREDICTED: calcium-binding protein P-like [Paralichthys olivaceus]